MLLMAIDLFLEDGSAILWEDLNLDFLVFRLKQVINNFFKCIIDFRGGRREEGGEREGETSTH